jgi:predicted LPLAT superfamily acyltransferase
MPRTTHKYTTKPSQIQDNASFYLSTPHHHFFFHQSIKDRVAKARGALSEQGGVSVFDAGALRLARDSNTTLNSGERDLASQCMATAKG